MTAYIGGRLYRSAPSESQRGEGSASDEPHVEPSEPEASERDPRLSSIVGEEGLVEDEASALAHGAEAREGLEEALADALAGHLDQAELGDVEHLRPRLVPRQGV